MNTIPRITSVTDCSFKRFGAWLFFSILALALAVAAGSAWAWGGGGSGSGWGGGGGWGDGGGWDSGHAGDGWGGGSHGGGGAPKNTFNILLNYELGMHCTGFEFAYCCVLPPYNSILAQVVKTEKSGDFPLLLQGDPVQNKDALGRETVVRDKDLDGSNNFKKYVIRYWHEAQPRNDGRGKAQTSTLISAAELNSLFMWNTVFDKGARDMQGRLTYGTYDGAQNVAIGNGSPDTGGYANGWLNHLYIYQDLEGHGATKVDADKIFLGIDVPIPTDCGPSLQPLGPVTAGGAFNDCGGASKGNLLTYSGDTGTIVFTQMKVLEDLPIMLTSPRIWEALGMPLTPFEDSIDFFGDPGQVDEDSIRPYVKMKAELMNYPSGTPVLDNGIPVEAFGTAPIDIPNCERCHSELALTSVNSAQQIGGRNSDVAAKVQQEIDFWEAYYNINPATDSTWYARLKGAAISILSIHDEQHGTTFTANYPGCTDSSPPSSDCGPLPQNTRLGHESVICQKCHADNVIAVVKSANCGPANELGSDPCASGSLIPPVTEAIHNNHTSVSEGGPIAFSDSLGRDGACQGCHPAHRSNGDMAGYPITPEGNNFYASSDNRLSSGGCFVGRDVHSNPMKDVDGAETPEHLNAVGTWLSQNVFKNQQGKAGSQVATRGIWCTNCHSQLSQEIWKKEDCEDLINSPTSGTNSTCIVNPRGSSSLSTLATALGTTQAQVLSWLDPKSTNPTDDTHRIWDPAQTDAMLATIEVNVGVPVGTTDVDGNFSVNVLSFCTTTACVNAINNNKSNPSAWLHPEGGAVDGVVGFINTNDTAVAVPFNAATDGRDHWLSAGEPHCADCHQAPYVEQSGNKNFFPPFNYPRKASLMRYSRGHQDITCQGCHESIHGLYPVTATIDTTTYAQAAALNTDGSHGPLKCNACHNANSNGVMSWANDLTYQGTKIKDNFDTAVTFAHTYTAEADPRQTVCKNCHGDRFSSVSDHNSKWLQHTQEHRVPRDTMDKVEILKQGHVSGDPAYGNPKDGVCKQCHYDNWSRVSCSNTKWKQHLPKGRVTQSVWEYVSQTKTGSTCGW